MINFDETELNILHYAVCQAIKSRKWDPMEEEDWCNLLGLKNLSEKLLRALDAEFDARGDK